MTGYTIQKLRKGKGSRSNIIYAELVNPAGETVISATLEYIVEALQTREFV